MKYFGLKLGVVLIILPLTLVGAWYVMSHLGAGSVIVSALAIIGACSILDGFADWASDKMLNR